jgi:hypothetical protein
MSATLKQKRAVEEVIKVIKGMSKATKQEVLEKVGYSKGIAKSPKRVIESKGFQELMDQYGLSDKDLAAAHKNLLNATYIDHMVFPVAMTDEEITNLLKTVNCVPKKFMHGETANHVWFWARDNKAMKDAIDMGYKLKGNYAPEKKEIKGAISLSDLFDQSKENE